MAKKLGQNPRSDPQKLSVLGTQLKIINGCGVQRYGSINKIAYLENTWLL